MADNLETPWLILDKRAEMANAPGLHALLIGISEYSNLPGAHEPPGEGLRELQRLEFAALSAWKLRQKLGELDDAGRLYRPLKTVRLLIAPSAAEREDLPDIPQISPDLESLRRAIKDWRDDVARSVDEMAFFYFVGHGIRHTPDETVLLASDFLKDEDQPLGHAFRISNITNGMAPSQERPNMGRHQYYFVDACRETSRATLNLVERNPAGILAPVINNIDDRCAPLYLATPPGGVVPGERGIGSAFLQGLLWAFDHGSPRSELSVPKLRREWPVKASSIKNALRCYNPTFERLIDVRGTVGDSILCYALDPPILTVRIAFKPDELVSAVAGGELHPVPLRERSPLPFEGGKPNPCAVKDVPAGLYQLALFSAGGEFEHELQDPELISVDLPVPWPVKVGR